MNYDLVSALIIGLLGAGHCIGMCGGISTMFATATNTKAPNTKLIIGYNVGRILSYAIIGALAGFTSSLAVKSAGLPIAYLQLISAIFLILLGLYIAQWLLVLRHIELIGKHVWRYIAPLTRKLMPVSNVKQSVLFGAVWGWLPCGLVYSALTWSLASGSAIQGALLMLCFGIGTLPAMLTAGFSVDLVKSLLTNNIFRKIVALSLLVYGIYTLQIAYSNLI